MAAKNDHSEGQNKPSLDAPMTARESYEKQQQAAAKKKKNFRIKTNWFYNKNVLAIIALISSFVLWCIVTVSDGNLSSTRTLSNIPIRIDTSAIEETYGLQMIDIIDPPVLSSGTVNVTLHGTVYHLSRVSEDDVTVTAQVSGVSRAGEFTLGLVPACSVRGVTVSIDNNYDFVKVWFDRIKQKELAIDKVSANGVTLSDDDLIIGDIVSNVKSVTVTGPESVIERIDKAQISASVNKELSEPFETVGRLLYLDSDGNELLREQSRYIEIYDYNSIEANTGTPAGPIASDDIKVLVPVNKTVTLPLGITLKNVPEGFDLSTLRYRITPDKIQIEGDIEVIDKYIEAGVFNIEGIDLSSVSPTSSTVRTKLNLSTGIEELSGVSEVSVAFDMNNYSSRSIRLDSNRIKLIGNPALKTKINTEFFNIVVVGPSGQVNSLTASDCTATVDMSGAELIDGQRKMTAVITINGKPDCWTLGSYTVMVDVDVISE